MSIELNNVERLDAVDFDKYLQIDATSNSFLKSEQGGIAPEFIASDKVKLGSMVDGILTEAHTVDMTSEFYRPAKAIAAGIVKEFGLDAWEMLESQVSFVADMEAMGLKMRIKGRLDKFGLGRVWDLKITHVKGSQIPVLIDFMGYRNQMWLYSKAMRCRKPACLIFYSVPDEKVYYHFVDVSSDENSFFSNKILKFGV